MRRVLARIALLLWAGATLVVATTSGFKQTHAWASTFFHDHVGLSPRFAGYAVRVLRKGMHVPAYALLAMLTWWALPARWQRVPVALGLVMAVAVADEVLQSLHPARTGRPLDLLVDLVGALLGLWVAGAFRRRARGASTRVDEELRERA